MSTPLGDFLRARRDATDPAAVGLSAGQRRRAPGLRRSELAALAGISVEYLVRIEQGRDRNPSVSVINALAEALRLDASERGHLHNGLLDGQYPNLTRFVFTDQRARRIFPEWERIADEAAFPLT